MPSAMNMIELAIARVVLHSDRRKMIRLDDFPDRKTWIATLNKYANRGPERSGHGQDKEASNQ